MSVSGATTFTTPAAQAQINATQAQVTQILATIAQEQQQSAVLGQEYDAAEGKVQTVQAQLAATNAKLARTRNVITADKAVLAKAAVQAYVLGSQGTQIAPLFVSSANTADVAQEYAETAIGNLAAAKQALEAAQAKLAVAEAQQKTEEQQAQAAAASVQTLEQKNQAAAQAAQATLTSVKGTLATEVQAAAAAKAQREAAAAAAAAARAQQAAAAAAAAAAQRAAAVVSAVGGTSRAATTAANQATASAGGPTITTQGAPGGGSGSGAVALQAAQSQLGVPYVWGGETPGVGFDCSGLTQWSWRQAGVSIPRTSQAQDASVPLVWTIRSGPLSLSSLQPGDLFFYTNLDGTGTVDHVAMYAGGDTLIQAPYTGANVSYSRIYTNGLVAVGRP